MKAGFIAFAKAVSWGALAGAAPFMVLLAFTLAWTPFTAGDLPSVLLIVSYPLIVAGVMAFGSAVMFGLPLTAFLARSSKQEHGGTYALAGLGLGTVVPAAVILAMGGEFGGELFFFAIPGAFAGLVTGTSWGRWREALNRR